MSYRFIVPSHLFGLINECQFSLQRRISMQRHDPDSSLPNPVGRHDVKISPRQPGAYCNSRFQQVSPSLAVHASSTWESQCVAEVIGFLNNTHPILTELSMKEPDTWDTSMIFHTCLIHGFTSRLEVYPDFRRRLIIRYRIRTHIWFAITSGLSVRRLGLLISTSKRVICKEQGERFLNNLRKDILLILC